ncbi:MAG: hypothetical protein VR65_11610 [Desulfobulbaceae bacterium BRH_c16a]|nr:MAG: hypothetical protein VR65_11610 [Desulfobulbaceae bacterium BRH_c16a]
MISGEKHSVNAPTKHTLGEEQSFCTGCTACAAICPVDAITMEADAEGFLHPGIHTGLCTDCGLCRKVCPVHILKNGGKTGWEGHQVSLVLAAWNLDENIRRKSSSGGVFTALAENILEKGGAVAGAAFDDRLRVRHCIITTTVELHRLRGSKYVQSEISPEIYEKIEHLLQQGRSVLFSGTPCQIAGIRSFLQKPYERFYCCDLVCMGVPSSLLFDKYIDWKNAQLESSIASCGFRDKTSGWKKPGMIHSYLDGRSEYTQQSAYYLAFIKRLALRPSCHACPFKGLNRPGDVTLADFWGVAKKYPEYDRDDKGTSLVLVNTPKGKEWLDDCGTRLFLGGADIDTAIAGNPMLVRPALRPPERSEFYHDLEAMAFKALIRKYRLSRPAFHQRLLKSLRQRLSKRLGKLIRSTRRQEQHI